MNFLPIVERDLRVAARRRGTYWLRLGLVGIGLLVSVPGLMWASPTGPATAGKGVFAALVGAGVLVRCCACLLTADVIRSGRRGGEVGVVFFSRGLTDEG